MDQKTNFVFQCDFCFDLDLPPPSTRERPPGCKTVFVGGLPENATEEIIQEVFEQCGDITAIRKSKKNFCHIRFAEEFMVDKAIYLSGTSHSLMDFPCFSFVFVMLMLAYFLSFYVSKSFLNSVAVAWSSKEQFCYFSTFAETHAWCWMLLTWEQFSDIPTMQQIMKFTTEQSNFRFTQVYVVLLTGCGKRKAAGQELCCFQCQFFW